MDLKYSNVLVCLVFFFGGGGVILTIHGEW